MPLQSHPLTTNIVPSPHNKLLLQLAISKAKMSGFKFKAQHEKKKKTHLATERSIPLVAGLERHVKKGKCATVEESNSEGSQSNDRTDLDEDDNAYDANIDNAASDEEDGVDDSDNFYTSILGGDWGWEDLTPNTNIPAIPDHYMSPHGLKPGI
eukprot:10318912-Ditylum_brightwellii.AAC.1